MSIPTTSRLAIFAAVLLFSIKPVVALDQPPPSPLFLPQIIENAKSAAVEVLVDGQLRGGGAFVSADGLIITAAHLLKDEKSVFEIITSKDKRLPARLTAFDKGHDLALLKIERKTADGQSHRHLPVARKIPATGRRIFSVGNALRNRAVLMAGIVAQSDLVFNELAESNGYIENFYVAAMTPSLTSGGVWINVRGEIVGVQSGRLNDGKLKSGIAIVAPPHAITALVESQKTTATAGIGCWIWELWTADKDVLKSMPPGTEGLVITWLRKGGPMEKAGLKRLDVILEIDGEKVRRRPEFLKIIRKKAPGERVTLTIRKPNEDAVRKVDLELENLEEFWLKGSAERREKEAKKAEEELKKN